MTRTPIEDSKAKRTQDRNRAGRSHVFGTDFKTRHSTDFRAFYRQAAPGKEATLCSEGSPMKPQVVRALVVLTLAAIFAGTAYAEYPERNVTVVVPFPPGGASDVTARLTGNKLAERLGKSIIIENRAGANGGLGATGVKSAVPDGYTLLIGSIGVYAINPVLYKNLKYDPLKDFDLLSLLVRTPNVLVTSPDFPVNSAGDLIAHLKINPNRVMFASSGIGSSDHLTAVLFWQNTGTSGVHVPYKGGGPAINDLM